MDFSWGLATYLTAHSIASLYEYQNRQSQGCPYQLDNGVTLRVVLGSNETKQTSLQPQDSLLALDELFPAFTATQPLPEVRLTGHKPAAKATRFESFGFELPLAGRMAVASGFMVLALSAIFASAMPSAQAAPLPQAPQPTAASFQPEETPLMPQIFAQVTAVPSHHQFRLGRVGMNFKNHRNIPDQHENSGVNNDYQHTKPPVVAPGGDRPRDPDPQGVF